MTPRNRPSWPGRCLLVGGARSGKSALAERLVEKLAAPYETVTYLATGPALDAADATWQDRVAAHQQRRPTSWRTVETCTITDTLRDTPHPVLWDDTGTWVAALLDARAAWDDDEHPWWPSVRDSAVVAWAAAMAPRVAVGPETGLGVIPEHRSGRLFRDLVGDLHQHLAAACDATYLVVAGKALALSDPPW